MKNNVLYQISTHWDREWYLQFQGFRFYLVRMVSSLLKDMEEGKITSFSFDGQTVVLEDYLEICPDDKLRIKKLIADNRLKIGPWYVMPDELLVSGESLIHNLLIGHCVAKSFGTEPQKLGYVNDVFGHIAQMPQIFNGFSIDSAYLGRGVGRADQKYTNFIWYAPNGDKCYSYKQTYCDFKREFDKADNKKGILEKAMKPFDKNVPVIVVNYSDDHAFADKNTYEFNRMINSVTKCEVNEGIENLSELLKPYEGMLPSERGELISTAEKSDALCAVTHSISSYYPIKKENDECEQAIYYVLAPIMIMSDFLGLEVNRNYYDLACRYLLKNQPHDSICGCSIDAVHKDMLYRYSQAKAIVNVIAGEFNHFVSVYSQNEKCNSLKLSILNFDIHQKKKYITAQIEFPENWDCSYVNKSYYKKINMFNLVDDKHRLIPYQILKIDRHVPKYYMSEERFTDVYTVAFEAELNSFGNTVYNIEPSDKPMITPQKLSDGCLTAENDYIALEINNDGSVNITDKATCKTYKNLNTFIDDGDCGNGWFYTKTDFGEANVISSGSDCTIEVVCHGPIFYSYRIIKRISVPKTVNYEDYRRSEQRDILKIVTVVSLNGNDKKVEFNTTVENNIKNHRLRVMFPTCIKGNDYISSQAFCFVKRYRGITDRGAVGFEPEAYEKNTGGIIVVSNNTDVFSFVGGNGIHESSVSEDGTISVTLFRSVGKMYHEVNPSNCQLQGEMSFKYALTFENDGVKLIEMQKDLKNSTYCVTSDDIILYPRSFIEADNEDIVLSILKPALKEGAYTLRIYNPSERNVAGNISLGFEAESVCETLMSGDILDEYCIENNKFNVSLKPYEIKTFVLTKRK